jgi:hypothetical protein
LQGAPSLFQGPEPGQTDSYRDFREIEVDGYIHDEWKVRRNLTLCRIEWRAPAYHSVVQILQNPIYTGIFCYRGEMYEGKHEPIISKALFDQCQEVLARKSQPKVLDRFKPQGHGNGLARACCVALEIKARIRSASHPTRSASTRPVAGVRSPVPPGLAPHTARKAVHGAVDVSSRPGTT